MPTSLCDFDSGKPSKSNRHDDNSRYSETMSLELIAPGVLISILLGIGYLLVFRVEKAIAFQRRYAEALSSTPPSENPEFYEETYDHRKAVFRLGGGVLLAVGVFLLMIMVYGTVVVDSSP